MKVGIVGHGADKFNAGTKTQAITIIRELLSQPDAVLVSGHSPEGGVDIWAEDAAKELGVPMEIKAPKQQRWDAPYGYRARNLDIARTADEVHVIVIAEYPDGYSGMKFRECYHCKSSDHVKSGGCWTGLQAEKNGKTSDMACYQGEEIRARSLVNTKKYRRNHPEAEKDWAHRTGRQRPISEARDCGPYLGDLTEKILLKYFDNARQGRQSI